MIFFPEPQDGLLIAVNKKFNCVLFPVFSNLKLENGRLTLQVELKDRSFTREQIIEHLHDTQLRHMANYNDFPYKFQYFEHRKDGNTFLIKSGELKNWRERVEEAVNNGFKVQATNGTQSFSGKTSVNLALLETLEKACAALEYYKKQHAEEYTAARKQKIPLREGWRYEVA